MTTHLVRSKVLAALLVAGSVAIAACAGETSTPEDAAESTAALSFSSGNNDGYCASNPSWDCGSGTPLASKQLALTFDDGPGSQALVLSSYLRSQGIRATFFVNGHCFGAAASGFGQCQQGNSTSALLSQLLADGHLVANHTQDHYDLTTLGDSQILSELVDTDAIIAPWVASSHFVFRAPFGAWSAHDYAVLHASAMDKYVGPVKWDIGGAMTSTYGADWDCWQNADGYGVQTTQQCGDRYLAEITDVGRGIVLMHDADYGNVSNHSLTSGQGNTIDMVMYLVPILKQRGYGFVRIDEVPDIAAALGGPPPPPVDAGGGDSGGGTCGFNPTWAQTTYANDWWVEYSISGTVTAASLEIVGGATFPLSLSYDKWVGSPPTQIPSGTKVIVHATNSSGQSAATQPFGYLVTTSPVTACGGGGTDAGTDAGKDAGSTDAGGTDAGRDAGGTDAGTDAGVDAGTDAGGACVFTPTWAQGSGANNWWVEYTISGSVASASLEIVGGGTVTLGLQWGKWVGPTNTRIATGASVIVHAKDTAGHLAQTLPFAYLTVKAPKTAPCN